MVLPCFNHIYDIKYCVNGGRKPVNAAFQAYCLTNGSGRTTSLSELKIDERLYRGAFYLNDDVDDGHQ